MIDTILKVPQGVFELTRASKQRYELLRAWDAADEYLLEHLDEAKLLNMDTRILIVNDNFGALSIALHKYSPVVVSDSYLAQLATTRNLISNGLKEDAIQMTSVLELSQKPFDLVLIKVPKTLALLEYELIKLKACVTSSTNIILAGMVKALPKSVWSLCERIIGSTSTSLAKKKSRLIFVTVDESKAVPINPYPVCYQLENTDYKICNHANVFSRDSLDIGTRFFLEYLPRSLGQKHLIDLGCGNGIVGLMAAHYNKSASIYFIDESYMAIASAKQNFVTAFGEQGQAKFMVADGLSGFTNNNVDLILCNPPFHQQHAVGVHIAQQMFQQSFNVLKPGGELWVIGNRHLAYHVSLKRIFSNVLQIAVNNKFVVLKAIR